MKTIYCKCSDQRRKQFALTTKICLENKKKVVEKEACFSEGISHLKNIIKSQQLFAKYYKNVNTCKTWIKNKKLYSEFINGTQLSDLYIKAIKNKDKEEISRLILYHFKLMSGLNNNTVFKATDDFIKIFGETNVFENKPALIFTFFEADPANIIFPQKKGSKPYFIDYEWFFDFPIPADLVKFRIISQLSMFRGMDDIINIDDRIKLLDCALSYHEGMGFINKFYNFVYVEKNIDYLNLNKIYEKRILNKGSTLYFDTGNGYCESNVQRYFFIESKVNIYSSIPMNTVKIRLDPAEGFGCILSNLEIISNTGSIIYEPLNGYKNENQDMVFVNNDPQIEITGAVDWLKIKYDILLLTEYFHYRVLEKYIAANVELNNLLAERDGMLNSRSWRITKPLRSFGAFVRRHKVLRLFAKGLLSLKKKWNY